MMRRYHILVIEDDPNLLRTLALLLGHAGYSVTAAASMQEGLLYLKQVDFDLIVLDAGHPEVERSILLPYIRKFWLSKPVVILTAQALPEPAVEPWQTPASCFLPKPVDPECILAQVRALLPEKRILDSIVDHGSTVFCL